MTFAEQDQIQSLLIPETGWVRRFVDTYKDIVETPAESLAGTAYTVLSAAVGWRSYVEFPGGGEPLNLYTVLIGGSASAHKTTMLKIGTGIARDANKKYRYEMGLGEDDRDYIRVITGGHMSGAGFIEKIKPADQEEAEKWNVEMPPGVLLEWDELGDLVADSNNTFLNDTKQMLLRCYSGYQPGRETMSSPADASRCSVSMIGTITEKQWQGQLTKSAVNGGMMGRLFAIPTGRAPQYHSIPKSEDRAAREELVEWLYALGRLPQVAWGPQTFSDEAAVYWDDWYMAHKRKIESMEDRDETLASVRNAIFNRYQTTARKFAGLQTISQWSGRLHEVPSVEVGLAEIKNACAYTDLALEQAAQIAVGVVEEADERFIRKVRTVLNENGGQLQWSRLMQKARIHKMDGHQWKRNLELCQELGYLKVEDATVNTPHGEKTTRVVSLGHE